MTSPATAFAAWIGAIETATKAITFVGPDIQSKITTAPGLVFSVFSFSIVQNDIKNAEDVEEIVGIIASKMYDSLIAAAVSGVTSAGTSTTPGSGTVTYSATK
jgi:ABC-type Co2+ transport system permease subunit